jgi:hypothetical protein
MSFIGKKPPCQLAGSNRLIDAGDVKVGDKSRRPSQAAMKQQSGSRPVSGPILAKP